MYVYLCTFVRIYVSMCVCARAQSCIFMRVAVRTHVIVRLRTSLAALPHMSSMCRHASPFLMAVPLYLYICMCVYVIMYVRTYILMYVHMYHTHTHTKKYLKMGIFWKPVPIRRNVQPMTDDQRYNSLRKKADPRCKVCAKKQPTQGHG